MQATEKIKNKTKLLWPLPTLAPTSSNTKPYLVPIINCRTNIFFSYFSNSIMGTWTPTFQYFEEEQACLIKKNKCFSYKQKGHTAYDCPSKGKIAVILKSVSKNSKN